MRQVFVKELSAYTISDLAERLCIDFERAAVCVEALTARGVLRLRSGTERDEYDIGDPSKLIGKYQFVYVGLTIFEDLVIVVYPKYMDSSRFANDEPGQEALDGLQQIFRVLRKSLGSYSDIASLSEGTRRFNDRIALMLMLMEMYGEYGVYSNHTRILKQNYPGEISWERTISMHKPFVSDGALVYFEYETIVNTRDEADFIMRLHKCVLTECSNYMKESGLGRFLALDEIELSDENLEGLGDKNHVFYQLDRERTVQFVSWKQDVLDLLERYVDEDKAVVRSDEVICLGSTSFYNVWEKACKVAFGDMLHDRLGNIGVSLEGRWKQLKNKKLLNIVPSPQWVQCLEGEANPCGRVATLIPDTVTIWNLLDGGKAFVILDAKYYTPQLGKNPRGVPGVESVTKQILYQSAYRKFVLDHGFGRVINAFLVPHDGDAFKLMGHVEFPSLFRPVEPPFVDGIDMWFIPAELIWRCYIEGRRLPDEFRSQFLIACG